MKINEIITEAVKQRLDAKCWKGKHKEGTKIKSGVKVNNCVSNESVSEGSESLDYQGNCTEDDVVDDIFGDVNNFANMVEKYGDEFTRGKLVVKYDPETDVHSFYYKTQGVAEGVAWQKKSGKNKNGGLNQKGVDSYRKEHPGSKLQTAVTTKPSKLKAGSKDAKRRKSFCARMSGVKGPMKDEHGKPTRKALSLKKWNC